MTKPTAPILDHMIWAKGTGPKISNNMPFPILGALGAAGSLAGSIIGGINQRKANKRAYDQQLELWRMNNQYNHPSAQMQRLREAGLNPNLVYGQGARGATGQATAPSTPPVGATPTPSNPITAFQNIQNSSLQTDNLRAQNTLLRNKNVLDTMDMALKQEDLKKKGTYNSRYAQLLDLKVLEAQNQERMSSIKASFSERDWYLYRNNQQIFNSAILSAQQIKNQNLTNAQKLGQLRDLEIDIKNSIRNFKDANEITKLLYPILLSIIR